MRRRLDFVFWPVIWLCLTPSGHWVAAGGCSLAVLAGAFYAGELFGLGDYAATAAVAVVAVVGAFFVGPLVEREGW